MFQLRGDHTPQPPRETLCQGTGEENLADSRTSDSGGTVRFSSCRGTLDQLYTLSRVLEGAWEFAQPIHMCFVDLEKAFDCVPRAVKCRRVSGLGTTRFLLCFLWMMLSCWPLETGTFGMHWDGLQPSVKRLG